MSMFIRSLTSNLRSISSQAVRSYCQEPKTIISTKPITSVKRYSDENNFYQKPREVWLGNMDSTTDKKLGLITLHPEVFAASPRIDVIHENVRWQKLYRFVSYAITKTRAEVRGGGKKPWPQKGSGRARHGSIRSPIWKGGGRAHGPRGPTSHFYMLPFQKRVAGITSTLSVKLAQDDLHIVDSLDIPAPESSFVQEVIDTRNWGPSVLFVDVDDIMPKNIALATDEMKHVNLMPVYGLNVHSMLKHDTVVLTEKAARLIEEKLLYHMHRIDDRRLTGKFKISQQ